MQSWGWELKTSCIPIGVDGLDTWSLRVKSGALSPTFTSARTAIAALLLAPPCLLLGAKAVGRRVDPITVGMGAGMFCLTLAIYTLIKVSKGAIWRRFLAAEQFLIWTMLTTKMLHRCICMSGLRSRYFMPLKARAHVTLFGAEDVVGMQISTIAKRAISATSGIIQLQRDPAWLADPTQYLLVTGGACDIAHKLGFVKQLDCEF